MHKIFFIFLPLILISCAHKTIQKQKLNSFVIVVPSYNNIDWFHKNINSIIKQKYPNMRTIYIDDCSPDGTGPAVQKFVKKKKLKNFTFIQNTTRVGALANHYKSLQLCNDTDIVVHLDGDDWFAHSQVLKRINHEYTTKNVWLTYGQFRNWPTKKIGWCKEIPQEIINKNQFREFGFCSAQLRTFYAWLGKKIHINDLYDSNENFYTVAGDTALMFPMLERSASKFAFINDVLYIRNIKTPINDYKIHQKEQERITRKIRKKKKYQPCTESHQYIF